MSSPSSLPFCLSTTSSADNDDDDDDVVVEVGSRRRVVAFFCQCGRYHCSERSLLSPMASSHCLCLPGILYSISLPVGILNFFFSYVYIASTTTTTTNDDDDDESSFHGCPDTYTYTSISLYFVQVLHPCTLAFCSASLL